MINQDMRRFAPYGLYLAGLALLASGIIYIILHSFTLPLQISLGLVVVGLALFVLLDPERARVALTGRQARHGSNALLLSVGFIGILVVVNFIGNQYSHRWDLTEDQTNTLAPETIKTLESLKAPVTADAFYSSQFPIGTTQDLLQNYKLSSNGKFDYQVIDPVQQPLKANQDQVTRDGTIVLRSEGRMEQVSYASEQELTAALIRLANPGKRVVYFLTGHGEHDINGTDVKSYSEVKKALTAKNYTVNTLDLLSKPQVPDDAQAVIVAGPDKPLADTEVAALKAYVDKGGSLVYLTEPRPVTQFADQPDPLAAYLAQSWGIQIGEDVVIDLDNQQAPLVAIGSQLGSHSITDKMYNVAVVLPVARSVSAGQAPQGISLTQLVSTSQNSWGETDYQSIQNQQVTLDAGKDIPGPVPLAVAGENATTKSRVVVIGDSDFASSQYYPAYGNSDFILNSIDWAAEQDNLISLTPKQTTNRFLLLPQQFTMGLILFGSVFLLPGIVLLTGITTWVQRRRKG